MPIYAYACGSCGHAEDVMQKITEGPLTTCPKCGTESFTRQLTAAGFTLKGSGWYVTDFKNGGKPAQKKQDEAPAHACGSGGCSACS